MKKNLLLLFAIGSAFLFSCRKNDFPDPKKICQITLIDREFGPTFGTAFEYQYNEKRLLTTLIWGFNRREFKFEYNDHGRLLTMRDAGGDFYFSLSYKNGLVTNIDEYHPSLNFVRHGLFLYDSKGRLIEKRGLIDASVFAIAMVRYEYEGHSRNPRRELFFRPSGESGQEVEADPAIIREFKYDKKVNPQTTFINLSLSPFVHGDDFILGPQFFEAIADNNVVYMKMIRNIEGVYFIWLENFVTYEYDGQYPTFQTMRTVQHSPDGFPDTELIAHTKMSYDCIKK